MTRSFRLLAGFVFVLLVTLPGEPAVNAQANGPVAVTVTQPKKQAISWVIEQPGSVQPFEMTTIEARVGGYLKSVKVDLGDEVRGPKGTEPGMVLAELDVPELVQEFESKKASVDLAKADEEAARKFVDVAEARVNVAKPLVTEAQAGVIKAQADLARWESELARLERLASGGGAIDQQLLDEAKRQAESARAARQAAEARVEGAKATLVEADAARAAAIAKARAAAAQVKVAEAHAIRASVELGFASIRAPFDGIVTARYVHPGHLVKPSANAILTVARVDVVRVALDIPEAASAFATKGTKALVRVPTLGGRDYDAAITRTNRVLNPETRTMRAEIDVANTDGTLKPGMFATVRINASIPDALMVPPAAVLFADETAYCYAVENGKAVKLRMQVGRSDTTGHQLLMKRRAGGDWQAVTGQEQIVLGNLGALADGQAVTVKTP